MGKVHIRTISESISMKTLFDNLKIPGVEHATYNPKFDLFVEGPGGYNKIKSLFRTENQISNTLYFSNGKSLECSEHHKIKCNGEWKKAKDILIKNDVVETCRGVSFLTKKHIKKNKKILYDISVEDTHCYYSNDILSHNSWGLISLGLHALKMGKNVLHITLELSEDYTSKRYDARLTGILSSNLKYHVDEVVEAITNNIKGKLNIKFYPTKSITVNGIRSLVEKTIMINRKPDLIIIDYGDLIKSDNPAAIKAGSYQESGTIYEELRGLAGEFDVPVWTGSQANRSSSDSEVIKGEDVSESYKKIMIADFVVSISRKTEDKLQNTARWHVIKNRYGVDGITFPGRINTNIGHIEIFSPTSIKGTETKKTMQLGGEAVRKALSERFKDFEKGA